MAFSRSQVDKLGDRLRKSTTVSPEDLALLQRYIDSHADAQSHVVDTLRRGLDLHPAPWLEDLAAMHVGGRLAAAIQDADITKRFFPDPTTRLKTRDTTLEKLRRQPTRLSTIQDIAGCRVVLPNWGRRLCQQMLVTAIKDTFPGSRVLDRCETPSFGYRAVHVIVPIAGLHVEVQVRTSLQDRWAQTYEGLADRIGREIRYGQAPDESDDCGRQTMVDQMQRLGDDIATLEELHLGPEGGYWLVGLWDEIFPAPDGPAVRQFPGLLRATRSSREIAGRERAVEAQFEDVRRMLDEQEGS